MGGCCGRSFTDEEIEKCNSLQELSELLLKRKETFLKESEQINQYLQDPNIEVENIDVNSLSPDILEKRVYYLKDLYGAFTKLAETFQNNPDLPLDECKNHSSDIAAMYFQTYDPSKDLDNLMNKFDEFVEKQKK